MLFAALARLGTYAVPYVDAENPDRPLTLHIHRSEGFSSERPVVFVQHGMLRNGDDYRNFWIPAADEHGLLIIATTFSDEAYPLAASYNDGLARDGAGLVRPRDAWSYATLARLWTTLREEGTTARERVHVFGHSAGGQFVHRLLSTQDHNFIETAIVGNSGWYTLPTLERIFPEGLGGVGLDDGYVSRLLAFPLIVAAGDQDVAIDDPNLPSHEEALRQGPHRLARAGFYFDFGRREAERLGVPFGWTLREVPGIGHDGAAMSAFAARLWFGAGMDA